MSLFTAVNVNDNSDSDDNNDSGYLHEAADGDNVDDDDENDHDRGNKDSEADVYDDGGNENLLRPYFLWHNGVQFIFSAHNNSVYCNLTNDRTQSEHVSKLINFSH